MERVRESGGASLSPIKEPLSDSEIESNKGKKFKLECGEEGFQTQDEIDESGGILQGGLQVRENSGGKVVDHPGAVSEEERELVAQWGEGGKFFTWRRCSSWGFR